MLPGGGRALEDDDGKPPRFLLSFILSIDILLLSLLSLFVVVVVAKMYSFARARRPPVRDDPRDEK